MKGDYGSLAWVNDKEGHEFVCTVDKDHLKETKFENLNDNEKSTCQNVNQIVGTERW
jgi:hypothetical protein